jgi:hypothetical protein
MEDPGKRMVKEMQETTELQHLRAQNKELRAHLRTAQKLLSQAVSQRDNAKRMLSEVAEHRSHLRSLLASLEDDWQFKLYPRWLKLAVRRQLP